jgi:hypothetical protein
LPPPTEDAGALANRDGHRPPPFCGQTWRTGAGNLGTALGLVVPAGAWQAASAPCAAECRRAARDRRSRRETVPTFRPRAEYRPCRQSLVTLIDGVTQHDPAALGAGHGALDHDQATVGVGLDDLQVLRGHALIAHVAGHLLALEHLARVLTLTGRAVRTVRDRHAVRGAQAAEVVPLHGTGESPYRSTCPTRPRTGLRSNGRR